MDSIELIRSNLVASRDFVFNGIEQMREHAFVPPTPNGGGHTLWTLGHLAFIEGQIILEFMRGEVNPLADWKETFDGAEVSADPETFPPFDEVLAACRERREGTVALIDTLSEADLDRPGVLVPPKFEAQFGTYRRCLQFMADHWYMHRGQLADARRAARLKRTWV